MNHATFSTENDKATADTPSQQAYTFVMMPVQIPQRPEPKLEEDHTSAQIIAGVFWGVIFLLAALFVFGGHEIFR